MKEPRSGIASQQRLQDRAGQRHWRFAGLGTLGAVVMLFAWTSVSGAPPRHVEAAGVGAVADSGALMPPVTGGATLTPVSKHPFGNSLGMPRLAKGVLLVASRELVDPNFRRTVVLLVAQGKDGAMGVVVNRPTSLTLGEVLPDIEELAERSDTLYIGGPVATSQITLLLRAADPPENSEHVFHDVYFSGSLSTLLEHVREKDLTETMKAYAGYAGWAPGQLEGEVERGDWSLIEGNPELVFTRSPERIWRELIRQTSGLWVKAAERHLGMVELSDARND